MSKSQILLSNKPSSYNPILIQDNYEKEINMFVSNIPSNITEEYVFIYIICNLSIKIIIYKLERKKKKNKIYHYYLCWSVYLKK